MRRLAFIATLAAGGALSLAARAQERMRRVGLMQPLAEDDPEGQPRIAAVREALHEVGWISGKNTELVLGWLAGDAGRGPRVAAELLAAGPEVVIAIGIPVVRAIRSQSRTVPIVFVNVVDPVGQGIVESLARPGGNVTGFTHFEPAMGGKWLGLLKEMAPQMRRVAFVYNPESALRGQAARFTSAPESYSGALMRRREVVAFLATAAASPQLALAQERTKVARIGFLGPAPAANFAPRVDALRAGLRELGYVEGQGAVLEPRWGEGQYDRLPGLVNELLQLKVDVMVVASSPASRAARRPPRRYPSSSSRRRSGGHRIRRDLHGPAATSRD